MFSHIITFHRLFSWPFSKVRLPGFKNRGLFTAYQLYASASKSGIKNDQAKEFVVRADLACPVTIRQSFTLRPEEPRTPSRTRRVGTGTPSRARHGAQRGPRSAATPPPRRPQARRGPTAPERGREPPTPTLRGPEPPGTQARQLGRAASAAMTATRGSAPRAKARGPPGWEESRPVRPSVCPPGE